MSIVRSWGDTLAPATQTGTLTVLSGVLSYGVRQQLLPANVVRDLHRDDRPGTERTKQPRYLTKRDAEARTKSKMSNAYRPVAALMYYNGPARQRSLGPALVGRRLRAWGTGTVNPQRGPRRQAGTTQDQCRGQRTLRMSQLVVR